MNAVFLAALLQAMPVVPPPSAPSVYHVVPARDVSIALGASLTSLLAYLYGDHLITPRCPCDPREVNGFDRGAIGNTNATARRLSDLTAGAAIAMPLVLDAIDVRRREPLVGDAIVFAQTLAVNSALVGITKVLVHRPLPRTYAGDSTLLRKAEGYRSFYSGHTSLVFAALSAASMTIRLRHGEKTWPWVVTALVGTSVAVERVADGRHFPSDVMVGAVMGTAVGIVVPALHARRGLRGAGLSALPTPDGGVGLGLQYRF